MTVMEAMETGDIFREAKASMPVVAGAGMPRTQAIVLAPCSLCLVSYLNVVKEPSQVLAALLYGCVLLSLLFILVKLPLFFSVPFAPGFAGLTFPMAIGVVASTKASAYLAGIGNETLSYAVKQVAGIQVYVTTAVIGMVLFGFAKMLVGKKN